MSNLGTVDHVRSLKWCTLCWFWTFSNQKHYNSHDAFSICGQWNKVILPDSTVTHGCLRQRGINAFIVLIGLCIVHPLQGCTQMFVFVKYPEQLINILPLKCVEYCGKKINLNLKDVPVGRWFRQTFLPLLLSSSFSLLTAPSGVDFVSFCRDKSLLIFLFINCRDVELQIKIHLLHSICLACSLHDLFQALRKRKLKVCMKRSTEQ